MRLLKAATIIITGVLFSSNCYAAATPESFAPLVEEVMPAVVNISSAQKVKQPSTPPQRFPLPDSLPSDPTLDEFRGLFDQFEEGYSDRPEYSLGSGFIIDPAGYVVTNNHVLGDAEEITVILHDDKEIAAEIVGRDERSDLALLKIKSDKPLPSLKFGNSDAAKVGDWILAIGNPFGLGGSVSAGIISARARDINAGIVDDFLQTDAAINRGNSGGPMFNTKGEVIGINTAIYSPSGGSVGIGFALPSSVAAPIIKQLREYGQAQRAWLGVKIQTVTKEMAEGLGLKEAKGAAVLEVTKNSPGDKGGIVPSDIIIEFDGRPIEQMRNLPRIVAETAIDKKVKVVVWRQGKKVTLSVTLAKLEENTKEEKEAAAEPEKVEGAETVAGVSVANLTPQLRNRFKIEENVNGIVIATIDAESEAGRQGLRPGDVIVTANQEPVANLNDFKAITKQALKDKRISVLILVNRQGDTRFAALPITK